jgi:PPOX class probable F420-dependent enzyme
MTSEKIAALLSKTNLAIVGVNRVDGGPQLTPVRYFWDGETFRFSTTTDRAKYANLRRNPSLTLLVDDPLGYVAAYGEAEIIEVGFAELVRPIMEKYMPGRVEVGMAIATQPNRVLVRLRPAKLLPNEDALYFAQATGLPRA